ncbi:MAG TPA: enoyl-ACP reductase [Thermodesulfobacteriota bacterium]|nr:enoyl-ACP reductase [Thermodesulfobacteriota bacterium]
MGLVSGKKALIMGVANEKSIAWGIAEALHREGAELAFTYPNETLEKRVRPLAESIGSKVVLPCDVTKDEDIDACFNELKDTFGGLDILVHSIAFANKDELKGMLINTSREGFRLAMDVSVYSFMAVCKRAYPLMKGRNGSIVTLSYHGARQYIPNYTVMGVAKAALEASVRYLASDFGTEGIRVNAISAGPIKTLAAMGIGNFRDMLSHAEQKSPMKRNVTIEEVGNSGLYLLSDLSSGVTGEIHYVDTGINIMGV